jgi:transcriptional regulator with XRE-family HTH domain
MNNADRALIREARINLGIAQARIAKLANIDRSRLSRWETGYLDLRESEVQRLCEEIDAVLAEKATRGELHPSAGSDQPPTYLSVVFGKDLAFTRGQWVISQCELERESGVPRSAISMFESGYRDLPEDQLRSVHEALASLIAEKRDPSRWVGLPSLLNMRPSRAVPIGEKS